jgi:hypothetical protein
MRLRRISVVRLRRTWAWLGILALGLVLLAGGAAGAQVNTADLSGQVLDPQGLAVKGAKVTVKNLADNQTRSAETDETGIYRIVGLPPGRYEITVEGGTGFAKLVNPEIVLTIGQSASFDAHLEIQKGAETTTVTDQPSVIETSRTAVTETVNSQRIDNLPINGRNYLGFALTASQLQRDSAPSIGAAPTSGINFGGQRARSNQVSVDGADAGDNSVNGIRATVSQEAVQEFQLIISNYMPEFGRAMGGVINIVTKSGGNEVHGNVFGFLRHKSIQARNPFSVSVDPATGALVPVKQPFTRVQAGATLGGPIKKDKTFYFFSYETTRRQETGFTNIGQDNFGLRLTGVPADLVAAVGPVPGLLTPDQAAFVTNSALPVSVRGPYFALAREGSAVALTRARSATFGFAPTFFITGAPLPASFVGLNSLRGNYPISEGTSLWSAKLDHNWNQSNRSFVRVNVSPSLVTGIQVNAQNQNFGQNAGSRTSLQQTRDLAVVGQHTTLFSSSVFNEARFQFARRSVHYGFSQLPGGDQVAVNIAGFAFFGREPFTTVDRIERRFQWTDNLSWIVGHHTFKFGGDINLIQLRSKKAQIFELNFGGLFNFGGLSASTFRLPDCLGTTDPSCTGGIPVPGFSAVQAYGLGIPSVFVQGIGNSNRPFDNKAIGFFFQDSWRANKHLTFNYGVRYDVELTPLFAASTPLNIAAEKAFHVVEGIPRDKNNWSPRFGLAWDPWGNQKTILRAGYGIFYDHPLLAIGFNSTTAEGALSTQLINFGATPSATNIGTDPSAFNASSIFQGILNVTGIPGIVYLASQQRFDPKNSPFFNNQTFITAGFPIGALPFTLPVAGNFVYGYAQQGNLTVEQQLWKDSKLSVAYTYTHGLHLNRPRNINQADPRLLTINAGRALGAGLIVPGSDPRTVVVPRGTGVPGSCVNFTGGGSILLNVPGFLGTGFATQNCTGSLPLGLIGTAAAFNFFRPSGPNPSFALPAIGGYPGLVGIATLAGYPTGFPGVQVPWGDVDQQESSGSSIYHGLTVSFSKRTRHVNFFSSYTWSHAIDDSTDLQTLLEPQDDRKPNLERSNSTFDQRHRWVTSAVFLSPYKRSDEGWWRKFLADFTVAPLVEVASGRPFTVLTGTDFNLNFGSNTDRPSVASSGGITSPFIPGVHFIPANSCDVAVPGVTVPFSFGCSGNLGRNTFVRPGFFQWDLRVSRKFYFGEKVNLEVIADAFNLFNRNNVADVSPLCNPVARTCNAGQPTAALDQRQFQFALKFNW